VSTIALVHGAWHDGACWDALRPELERRGHRVVAPDLPGDDPALGFEDYAAAVDEAVGHADDLVLVGHSMGTATVGVVAAERPVHVVIYLCPLLIGVPRPDAAPAQFQPDAPMPPDDDLGRGHWEPEDAVRRMYRGLPEATARDLAARLRPQAAAWRRPFPLTGYPDVPSVVIAPRDDVFFRPEWSRWAAEHLVRGRFAEIPGDHFPMIERPEQLAGLLDQLIAETEM
jgi:pimeloyl-ACP methyl ester carboxylesterase